MVKVCHVTSAHGPDDNRVFQKECRTLARAGYEVYYVVPGGSGESAGVRLVSAGKKPASRLRRMLVTARRAYEAARALDCEVYHIHDPELLPYGRKLARAGKKVIFDSHENYALLMAEKEYLPRFLRGTVARLYRRYETRAVREFAAVIIPCTFGGENVFAGRAARTVLLDNLPELAELPETGPRDPEAADTVGYAGRLSESRGITVLVRACALAGVRLRLAGPVTPAYRAELEAMPEYGNVCYEGVLPPREIPEFCGRISAGMCTLLNIGQYGRMDALPTKVYEYLRAGLPVILSDTCAARRLTEKWDCGVRVDPSDPADIARAIRGLLDDPARARQMGENGRRAVEAECNWETEGKKLTALYGELTGGPGA